MLVLCDCEHFLWYVRLRTYVGFKACVSRNANLLNFLKEREEEIGK